MVLQSLTPGSPVVGLCVGSQSNDLRCSWLDVSIWDSCVVWGNTTLSFAGLGSIETPEEPRHFEMGSRVGGAIS